LEPKRGLVKEGPLVFRKKEKKKKCNGYAFLFSDMFLLTQLDKPQSYTYVMHIPLEKTQFEKDPADAKDCMHYHQLSFTINPTLMVYNSEILHRLD